MLNKQERICQSVALAASAGKKLVKDGARFEVCPRCEGAGVLPSIFASDVYGVKCDGCGGRGAVELVKPKPAKYGVLSESLRGGYKNRVKP